MTERRPVEDPLIEVEGTSPVADRRALLALFGTAIGAAALSGCALPSELTPEEVESTTEGLSGAGTAKYADTRMDLRALAGTTTTFAVLKGINSINDGGGGTFIWSSIAAPDDGWSVLNIGSGNVAGWRRVGSHIGSVDSVVALRAVVAGAGSLILLRGYVAPPAAGNDVGGGLFYWSNVARPDDGGTIFNVNAGIGAGWRRLYSGALDVTWFGAVGDNLTAADVAIQRAVNAASSPDPYAGVNAGRTVLLPGGIYKLANPIVLNVHGLIFRGEGWQSALCPMSGVVAAIVVTNGWGRLSDFSVQGNSNGASVAGIILKQAICTKITNVYVNKCAGDGLLFDNNYATNPSFVGNNDNAVIDGCVVTNSVGYGIQLKACPDNNGMSFLQCQVQNNGKDGILIRGNENRIEGGDWSYNTGYGILLSAPSDTSTSVGNAVLYAYTDSAVRTVYNSGHALRSTVILLGGVVGGANPTVAGLPNSGVNDMVMIPDWQNSNSSGIAFIAGNSSPGRGIKITAATTVPVSQVYAEGDPSEQLWLFSKGTGGISLGYYADPFRAQFSKTGAVAAQSVPAGGILKVDVAVSNNSYSDASVKVGDIATASFNPVLPAGVYIRSVEVTAPAVVSVTFRNDSGAALILTGTIRVQVTAY